MQSWKTTLSVSSICVLIIAGLLIGRRFVGHTPPRAPLPTVGSPHAKPPGKKIFPPKDQPLQLPAYVWPPFNIRHGDGTWSGADVDITKAVLRRMGYRVEILDMPFKRILEEMRKGTHPGMLPCVVGGGREEYMLFSEPVSSIYSVLWKKKSDEFEWHTYDDLKGRRIGASYYHYGAGFLEAGKAGSFKLDMVASQTPELIHFRKLVQGKTDMFICELSVGLYIRHQNRPAFDNVDYASKGVGPIRPFCFPASRRHFVDRGYDLTGFMKLFNRHLRQYAKEGHRKKVLESYHMLVRLSKDGEVLLETEDTP